MFLLLAHDVPFLGSDCVLVYIYIFFFSGGWGKI